MKSNFEIFWDFKNKKRFYTKRELRTIWSIKNEDRVDSLTKKLMKDQYLNVYNKVYCNLASYNYRKDVYNKWIDAHPNGYNQEDYIEYIYDIATNLCNMINVAYDPLLTYKVDEDYCNFVGVLKDDPEVEITFHLGKDEIERVLRS